MRIGVVPAGLRASGGIFQASLAVLEALPRAGEGEDKLVVFRGARQDLPADVLARGGWRVETLPGRSATRRAADRVLLALGRPPGRPPRDLDRIRRRPAVARAFARAGVELVLYTAPTTISFEAGVPYVLAVYDLQHRLQPEFPEVSAGGEWEAREYLFRNGVHHATLVVVDSEVGREDVLACYGEVGVTADRVAVLPFVPPPALARDVPPEEVERVRAAHGLPEDYAFYPAQLWPHKNHIRVVEALARLRDEGTVLQAAFAGTAEGAIRARTLAAVRERAEALGVAAQVHLLGYVSDGDLAALYRGALCLVMPTFFGPTNLPVVEAWAAGCPVVTSDIRGVREQAGDAALLVDPRSSEAIAAAVARLAGDPELRRELAERGRARLADFSYEDYRSRLLEILAAAKHRVS